MAQVQILGGTENVSHTASIYLHEMNTQSCSQQRAAHNVTITGMMRILVITSDNQYHWEKKKMSKELSFILLPGLTPLS